MSSSRSGVTETRSRRDNGYLITLAIVAVIVTAIITLIVLDTHQTITLVALVLIFFAIVVRLVQKGTVSTAVRDSEARLREVIESINEGMFVVSNDARVEIWNSAMERCTNRVRGDVLRRPLDQAFPEIVATSLPSAIRESGRDGVPAAIEDIVLSGDSSRRVFSSRLFPFDGGVTVFFDDVTDRRRTEEALHEAQASFNSI